jgi:hypothetical protein
MTAHGRETAVDGPICLWLVSAPNGHNLIEVNVVQERSKLLPLPSLCGEPYAFQRL